MSNEERELLKEKIKKAIQLSAQKLVASKRANGQSVVVSKDGKIQVIKP
jgi:hypothetical protein